MKIDKKHKVFLAMMIAIPNMAFSQDIEPEKSITTSEVVVKADLLKRNAVSETYIITDSLRKGTKNGLQLFDKLQGITVDWVSDEVKIGENRNIPLMIDGRDVSTESARSLNPKRIKKVEVLRYPKGKYGDIPIILNIILHETYVGYDYGVHARNLLSFRNRNSNNTDIGTNITYTLNRWNLYGEIGMMHKKMFKATAHEYIYNDIANEQTATEDYHQPNYSDTDTQLNLSVGADYKIAPKHVISLQTWMEGKKNSNHEDFKDPSSLPLLSNIADYKAINTTTGLFYRGSIGPRFTVSSDLTFNYYKVSEDNFYSRYSDRTDLFYQGKKYYWNYNVDANYIWSDVFRSTIGYTFTRNEYQNKDRLTHSELFKTSEHRQNAYFSVLVNPTQNMNFIVGSNLLFVNEKNASISDGHCSWMPMAKFFWQPIHLLSLTANYFCDVQYPNLDQLSTVAYRKNPILWHKGNPDLRARIMHYMEYRINLNKIIQLTYMLKHSSNDITPWYNIEDNQIVETLAGSEYFHQYTGINGEYKMPHDIELNLTANYQWYKRKQNESVWHKGRTWYLDAMVVWRGWRHLSLMTGYFLRHDKMPLLQGKQYSQDEKFMLGAMTSLLKDKLSLSIAFSIPTNAISKRMYTAIDTQGFQFTSWENDRVNNTLMQVNLRYNIGKGHISKPRNRNKSESEKN
ncbi:outer membrane beta-barrel protein [Bacteroides timonensis]|uniref:outer membrane beta-barrel protein n=1 Tax=Bacteroides timonensis TaxID=1470345 RepID=UPI0005C57FB2|nr:outer membrane beta-barrel protein [Bacteroides timonensis]